MSLKEVIILGCGATRAECKYHCEVWSVNGGFTFAPRIDKLFMTDEEVEVNASEYDMVHLKKITKTLVLPAKYQKFQGTGIPVEIYPIDAVLARFPTRFYSNTIAYMMAYALLHTTVSQEPGKPPKVVDGYHKIWLFGIDMLTNSTYIQEKGGVEYWMGVALGMGVEVRNTRESATGKTWNGKMYGYYGEMETERLKERLYAPHELIRVSKASAPQDDWVLVDGEYRKQVTQVQAGQEVARAVK